MGDVAKSASCLWVFCCFVCGFFVVFFFTLSQVRCSFSGLAQSLAELIETIISLQMVNLVYYVSV